MFVRLARRLKALRSNRQTVSILAGMEDYQLRDIGIERNDIAFIIRRGRVFL